MARVSTSSSIVPYCTNLVVVVFYKHASLFHFYVFLNYLLRIEMIWKYIEYKVKVLHTDFKSKNKVLPFPVGTQKSHSFFLIAM